MSEKLSQSNSCKCQASGSHWDLQVCCLAAKSAIPPESAAATAPIARPTMATGTVGGIMGMVTPTAVNLVETMEMAETELQHDFQAASSVRVLPGRNLLVGAKSPIPKIRTLFWLRI